MLPFLAHGHLIPFLALARQIHQATGFKISIASTPLNIQYLSSTFNSSSDEPENDHIHLLELPFCSTDNDLPPNTENSENLSLDSIGKLLSASLSLRKPFHSLVSDIAAKQGHPPLCIYQMFSLDGQLKLRAVWGLSDSDEFHLPGFPDSCRFHINQLHHFLRNADGTDSWSKFFQSQFSLSMQSFGWASSSATIVLKNDYSSLSVAASGISTRRAGKKLEISIEKCMEWLESHSPLRPPVGLNQKVNLEQNTYQKDLKKEWRKENKRSAGQHRFEGGEESDRVGDGQEREGGDLRSKAMVIKEQLRASVRDEGEDKGSSVKALDDLIKTLQSKGQTINSIS
ncbi:hypothetical protein POTOM_053785 [Populus tomentosa]|uniref:Uncharacterized protein n=1 Tax=Populus tomentosa TaxID=118781 RepID=A0A8X7Y2F1_POPTO|nr:hypothetical protein POTOM_053785 [Populus tomentosa]